MGREDRKKLGGGDEKLSACKIETPVLLLDQFFTLELTLMDQDSGCVHSIISR